MTDDHQAPATPSAPSFLTAFFTFTALIIGLMSGLYVLEAGLHGLLLIAVALTAALGLWLGHSYHQLRKFIFSGIQKSAPALIIFLLIGVVIAAFIQAGTVATLIYYVLQILSPTTFLPVGLILCSLMSFTTGTSWGTVATIGIVLMSVGAHFGIPPGISAGMVIAGASFGDKMSPVSDTTNLAALSAETPLYRHIQSMRITTLPSYLLTFAGFLIIGMILNIESAQAIPSTTFIAALDNTFNLHWVTLGPLILMLGLSRFKVPAEAVLLLASIAAMCIAFTMQKFDAAELITSVFTGVNIQTPDPLLDTLVNRGGMQAMAWTLTLAIIAVTLGALLSSLGLLSALLLPLSQLMRRPAALITTSTIAATASTATLAEPYAAITLTGQVFKPSYQASTLDSAILSRTIEEGSTLTAALIPWTTTAVFYAAILGVECLVYAPYAILNWMNPLIGILFAWLGIGLRMPAPRA
ncbi:MAG: Na+/H+ antiporter NhaC family protein [Pseudomonadales bacterium]